jgi:hypothetical protein
MPLGTTYVPVGPPETGEGVVTARRGGVLGVVDTVHEASRTVMAALAAT